MNMLKIENIQHVYLNGKKQTLFCVYKLTSNSWILDYSTSVLGFFQHPKTIAKKHVESNGRVFDESIWAFS